MSSNHPTTPLFSEATIHDPSLQLTNKLFSHSFTQLYNHLYQPYPIKSLFKHLSQQQSTHEIPISIQYQHVDNEQYLNHILNHDKQLSTLLIPHYFPPNNNNTQQPTQSSHNHDEQSISLQQLEPNSIPNASTHATTTHSTPSTTNQTTSLNNHHITPNHPSQLPSVPPNPILFLQFNTLITKYWYSISIIHLQQFHISLSILCGINVTRYLIPTESYDKGTFSIQFPLDFYTKYDFLPHPHHKPSQNENYNHKILQFEPTQILSVLTHLYHTKQMSIILKHYLTHIINIPSFIALVNAILSPHFEFILPLTLPYTPTPALFHTIFTTLSILYHDLVLLLEPIYALLLNEESTNLHLHEINLHPFLFAQPSPHTIVTSSSTISNTVPTDETLSSTQNSLPPSTTSTTTTSSTFDPSTTTTSSTSMSDNNNNDTHISTTLPKDTDSSLYAQYLHKVRPMSLLINTLLDDGSNNVMRVTNGLK